jgi:hypothetical protein
MCGPIDIDPDGWKPPKHTALENMRDDFRTIKYWTWYLTQGNDLSYVWRLRNYLKLYLKHLAKWLETT